MLRYSPLIILSLPNIKSVFTWRINYVNKKTHTIKIKKAPEIQMLLKEPLAGIEPATY